MSQIPFASIKPKLLIFPRVELRLVKLNPCCQPEGPLLTAWKRTLEFSRVSSVCQNPFPEASACKYIELTFILLGRRKRVVTKLPLIVNVPVDTPG